MRIVFNTNYKSAATFIGMDQMIPMLEKMGHSVKRNDWDNYIDYDLVFFASPDSEVKKAKEKNPRILTCIIDPKTTWFFDKIMHKSLWGRNIIEEIKSADFLLVSSIEHRDYFLKYNPNPFIFYFFPQIHKNIKDHANKEKIVIGYHGNKTHLDSMADTTWALDKLSEKYDIELRAVYNYEKFGKWNTNRPKKCKVVDIQWDPDLTKNLISCDIGIVPSLQPVHVRRGLLASRYYFKKNFIYSHEDYLFRFKYSNGPGRIYVFGMLGIPVVTDASPSQCQFVQNEISGFVCCTKEGWYNNLERLIKDANLRSTQGNNLYKFINENYSIDITFNKLIDFIEKILESKK